MNEQKMIIRTSCGEERCRNVTEWNTGSSEASSSALLLLNASIPVKILTGSWRFETSEMVVIRSSVRTVLNVLNVLNVLYSSLVKT